MEGIHIFIILCFIDCLLMFARTIFYTFVIHKHFRIISKILDRTHATQTHIYIFQYVCIYRTFWRLQKFYDCFTILFVKMSGVM